MDISDTIVEINDIRNCLIILSCFVVFICYGLITIMNEYLDIEVNCLNKIKKLEANMEDKLILKSKEIAKINEKIRLLEKYLYDDENTYNYKIKLEI
jgi:hypothetical protein